MLKSLSTLVACVCLCVPVAAQDAARGVEELSAEVVRRFAARDFEGALKPARRALELSEKALGPEHELTATALNNLAKAYAATGRHDDARKLYGRLLGLYDRRYGPEGVELAAVLDSLGLVELHGRRDPSAAEPHLLRALAVREKALGPSHEEVVVSLRHLITVYASKNEPARAEPLLRRAVEIREKSFGPGDPKLVGVQQDYACLLRVVNKGAEAERVESRAYAPLLKAAAAASEPLTLDGSALACRAVELVAPDYDVLSMRGTLATTSVRVRVAVDESGKVTEAVAEGSSPVFRGISKHAALRTRFAPLIVEGRPVKFSGVLTYDFTGLRGMNDIGVSIR